MPPFKPLSSVNIAGSSSRKRPFTDITRSASRSPTPERPFKRRRRPLHRSPSMSSNSTSSLDMPESPNHNSSGRRQRPPGSPAYTPSSPTGAYGTPTPSPQSRPARFEGDGLDFRAPVMSAPNHASHTIDLTIEDDESSPPPRRRPIERSETPFPDDEILRTLMDRPGRRVEVIDVSDDGDDDGNRFDGDREDEMDSVPPELARPDQPRLISSSPDVEFVSARPLQVPQGTRLMNRPRSRHNVTDQGRRLLPRAGEATFGDILRRGTQFMFQNLNAAGFPIPAAARIPPHVPDLNPNFGPDDFEGLQFDYQRPAFAMGTRESEPPQLNAEPYKAPPPAQEGFTRDLEEEEILLCPFCEDELATGEGDVKQQVWIIKQCGHVYCGACATSRPVTGNKKDARRAKQRQTNLFKTCTVEGCGKSVTTKGSMFQIYL